MVLLMSIAGFLHNYYVITERTKKEVEKYIQERVEREQIYFELAEKNLDLFTQTLVKELNSEAKRDFEKEFSRMFIKRSNGTYSEIKNRGDRLRSVQTFLRSGVTVTPQLKKNMVILNDLIAQFGFAWSSSFTNLWFAGIEDYGMIYLAQSSQCPRQSSC